MYNFVYNYAKYMSEPFDLKKKFPLSPPDDWQTEEWQQRDRERRLPDFKSKINQLKRLREQGSTYYAVYVSGIKRALNGERVPEIIMFYLHYNSEDLKALLKAIGESEK